MEIDLKAVRKQLGLLNSQDNHAIERVIAIELAAAKTRIETKKIQKDAQIKELSQNKLIFEGLAVESKSLSKHLAGCAKATFFAVTIGSRLDEDLEEHLETDETPQAMVLDAIGSVACEALAQETDEEIAMRAKEIGYATTQRFSPGYGDWKVEGQKDVITFLKAGDIGISLTDSSLMLPRKSITAVKGWYYPK